jgi:serine protease AprX
VSWLISKAIKRIFPPPKLAAPAGGAPPPRRRRGLAAGTGLPGEDLDEMLPPEGRAIAVVQLRGPLLPQWREELGVAGADLLEHLGRLSYSARIEPPTERVSELPFVESVRPYRLADTIHPDHLAVEYVAEGPEEETTWELLVHPRHEVSPVVNLLEARRQRIDLRTDRKVRFTTSAAQVVRAVAALPEVAMIYEYVPPTLSNDRARLLTRIDADGSPTPLLSETGKEQVIGVADGGLDAAHPDFTGRISKVIARGRPNDPSDLDGHGTHVTGSILGSGAASSGAFRGMAPEATLFFQSIMDASGGLAGVDASFADVLDEAYRDGVRIHNNSWGTQAPSAYLANSRELDDFVFRHPDMLVVVAAGNSGDDRTTSERAARLRRAVLGRVAGDGEERADCRREPKRPRSAG